MRTCNDMKIGAKLLCGFLAVSLLLLIMVTFGIISIGRLSDGMATIDRDSLQPIECLGSINATLYYMRGDILKFLLYAKEREPIHKDINTRIDGVNADLAKYKATNLSDAEKAELAKFEPAWESYCKAVQNILGEVKSGNEQAGVAGFATGSVAYNARSIITGSVQKLVDVNAKMAAENVKSSRATYTQARFTLILAGVVGVLVALALGLLISRNVTKPLAQGVNMMHELSQGHLGTRLRMSRCDEIGTLARTMDAYADDLQNNLVAVLKKVANGDVSTFIKAKDEKDEISPALINVHKALNGMIQETKMLTAAALDGRLDTRGKAQNYRGGFHEIVQGMNDTLDAVIGPVNEAAAVLDRVAKRDLSARVQGNYKGDLAKIKNSLNLALKNLDEALTQVQTGAEQVASAAEQISGGSQSLSQSASQQAGSLEEISGSLNEIASMTQRNTANAKEARSLSEGARSVADTGVESMHRLSEAIDRIKESSDKTAKIVKTIDEIAFQTNLLALNAAVEAARAGDAGKGFAVVAEEVRNLAMRSAEAAKNTANLIDESVQNASGGVSLNQEVMKNLVDINTQIKKVSEVVAEIAAASDQQNEGVTHVNTAVEQLNQVTQQVAANAEESASASEELNGQAAEMRATIGTFHMQQDVAASKRRMPSAAAAQPSASMKPTAKPLTAKANPGRSMRTHNSCESMLSEF